MTDKVLLNILSQKTVNNDASYMHSVSLIISADRSIVGTYTACVEFNELPKKDVKHLFDWSNKHLKKLEELKKHPYPSHPSLHFMFQRYCECVKKLKTTSRRWLEKGVKNAISASLASKVK